MDAVTQVTPPEIASGGKAEIHVSVDEAARTLTFDVAGKTASGAEISGSFTIKVDPEQIATLSITQQAPEPGDELVQDPADVAHYTFTAAA